MNYSGFNYKTHTNGRYRPNFFMTTHRPRSFARYLRQPLDRRVHSYGIRVDQGRRTHFVPRDQRFRPYPRHSQQRMNYWGFDSPLPMSVREPPNSWVTGSKIPNIIRSLASHIFQTIHYIQTKGSAKLASYGCSPGCCCGGVAAATTVVIVSTGLGVGLAVGLQNDSAFMISTLVLGNTTNISNATAGR